MAPSATRAGFTANFAGGDYEDLVAAWRKVEDRVLQLAQQANHQMQKDPSIDDILQLVERAKESKEKANAKYDRFMSVVNNTLNCLRTVGNIVASGVSTAIPPASLCANALTFVIVAWQGYSSIYDSLADLLEKCANFLQRLECYTDSQHAMDTRLRHVAARHLELFVDICDYSIRLRKKHVKLVAFAKVLFLDDDGISGCVGSMRKLVEQESGLVMAQTYRNVSDLVKEQKEQKKNNEVKTWRSSVAKALGFEPGEWDQDGEPVPRWRTAYNKVRDSLIDDTGEWILKDSDCAFVKWATDTDPAVPRVFVLHGRDGSGKTFMMANVIKQLRTMQGAGSNIAVAYFFAQEDSKGTKNRGDILGFLSRSLLWQCAVGSDFMTRSMAQLCLKRQDFDGAMDLWSRLFFDNQDLPRTDTTFYILIDGLEEEDVPAVMPLLQRLAGEKINSNVRGFVTAQPGVLRRLESAKFAFTSVDIRGNGDDIGKYISHRLNRMDKFRDASRPGILDWRRQITSTLREKCRDDYFKLVTSLDAVENVDTVDEIEEVLENADKTRRGRIVAEIERLNHLRTPKEIAEINELILWIKNGKGWFTTQEMEAALAVNDFPRSLLPFDLKLSTKYTIFKVDLDGRIQFRVPEIGEAIPTRKPATPSGDVAVALRDQQWTMASASAEAISGGEISIVKHFLTTVCPPQLYQRFEFDHFFAQKLGAPSAGPTAICHDPANADIRIALSSLKVLTGPENEHTMAIRRYAAQNLLDHLGRTDLAVADRAFKAAAGPMLVSLFTTEMGIDALFWISRSKATSQTTRDIDKISFLRDMRAAWLYGPGGVDELLRWLTDADVVSNITINTPDGAFVSAFTKMGANLHEIAFMPAAKRIAERLMRHEHFLIAENWVGLAFLTGFLDKVRGPVAEAEEDAAAAAAAAQPSEQLAATNAGDAFAENRVDGAAMLDGDDGDAEDAGSGDDEEDDYYEALRESLYCISGMEKLPGLDAMDGPDKGILSLAQMMRIEEWALLALGGRDIVYDAMWEVKMSCFLLANIKHPEFKKLGEQRARQALQLDPNYYLACYTVAVVMEDNQESIQLLLRCIQVLGGLLSNTTDRPRAERVEYETAMARAHLRLGQRYWYLEEYDKAIDYHRKSFLYSGTCFREYAEAMYEWTWPGIERGDDYTMDLLSLMLKTAEEEWSANFNELYYQVFDSEDSDFLPKAASRTQSWEVLGEVYDRAIRIAGNKGAWEEQFMLYYWLGYGLYNDETATDWRQREARIVSSWESALEVSRAHTNDGIESECVEDIMSTLAPAYLEAARRYVRGADGGTYGGEAVRMAVAPLLKKMTALIDDASTPMGNLATLCYIARCHVYLGDRNEAKRVVLGVIKEVMAMLSDDDPSNDVGALSSLFKSIIVLGDHRNVAAALRLCDLIAAERTEAHNLWKCKAEDRKRETEASTTIDDEAVHNVAGQEAIQRGESGNGEVGKAGQCDQGGSRVRADDDPEPVIPEISYWCNGCDAEYPCLSELWICCDCAGYVLFDKNCHSRLLQGTLRKETLSLCNKNHEMLFCSTWDPVQALKNIPRGSLLVGDSVMTIDQWKKELHAEYIENVKVSPATRQLGMTTRA